MKEEGDMRERKESNVGREERMERGREAGNEVRESRRERRV